MTFTQDSAVQATVNGIITDEQKKPLDYAMGYSTSKSPLFKIDAKSLNITLQDLQLKSGSIDLIEVKISATKPLFERKTDKMVMNVENSSLMTRSSALEVRQKAPGVTVDQNDNISIQGKQGCDDPD